MSARKIHKILFISLREYITFDESSLLIYRAMKDFLITTTVSSILVMYYATPLCGRAILLKAACARKLCANRGTGCSIMLKSDITQV